jgi:hypothetical protein
MHELRFSSDATLLVLLRMYEMQHGECLFLIPRVRQFQLSRCAILKPSVSYCTHTVRCTGLAPEPNQLARRLCTFGPSERYSCIYTPKKARLRAVWTSFEKLALKNTYFGCVAALPMYGDPCVRVIINREALLVAVIELINHSSPID